LAVDDFSTGDPQNVQHLESHPRFELLRGDVTQPLPAHVVEAERLYNLACPASPSRYQRAPVQTTLTSVLGVWQLLALAERTGARVFQASTSEVYGDPLEHPQAESYRGHVNPIGPRACYDEGKRCAETLCFAYHLERKVAVRIGRLFNSYGPRLRPGDGRVVSTFIEQALRGDPLTVYGTGRQTRSFCYVDDTVEAMWRLMDGDVEGPLNIGSPVELSVLELAEWVLRLTRSRSRIEHRPLPADDPHRRCPDISRMQRHFGWEPRVNLEDGLRATIEYFQRERVTT
jgi:UDP-glucuronate decarboxylase